jgi:hypothetical protein
MVWYHCQETSHHNSVSGCRYGVHSVRDATTLSSSLDELKQSRVTVEGYKGNATCECYITAARTHQETAKAPRSLSANGLFVYNKTNVA